MLAIGLELEEIMKIIWFGSHKMEAERLFDYKTNVDTMRFKLILSPMFNLSMSSLTVFVMSPTYSVGIAWSCAHSQRDSGRERTLYSKRFGK